MEYEKLKENDSLHSNDTRVLGKSNSIDVLREAKQARGSPYIFSDLVTDECRN
jgi:hypothetical protein